MLKINTKEVDITKEMPSYFQPFFHALTFPWEKDDCLYYFNSKNSLFLNDPDKSHRPIISTVAWRSGRGTGKSVTSAFIGVCKLFEYHSAIWLVNAYEFSSCSTRFISDLREALYFYGIKEGAYHLDVLSNALRFEVPHKGHMSSIIQFNFTGSGDLKAQGVKPDSKIYQYGKFIEGGRHFVHRTDYELGTWSGWTMERYENFNSTFDRSCMYLNPVKKKNPITGKEDWECVDKTWRDANGNRPVSPFITVAEYNMPSRDQNTYTFMKQIDNAFISDTEVCRMKFNYMWMTDKEKDKFIGERGMNRIAAMKKNHPKLHEQIYLGDEVAGNNNIYQTFDRNVHLMQVDADPFAGINWQTAKVNVGIDVGTQDPTSCKAYVIWERNDGLKCMRLIAHWTHGNSSIHREYRKWDWDHRTRDDAEMDTQWKFFVSMEYEVLIQRFLLFVHDKVAPFLRLSIYGGLINLRFESAGIAKAWYQDLFYGDGSGMSIFVVGQRADVWWKRWLNPIMVTKKNPTSDTRKEARIPFWVHIFCIDGAYTTLSEDDCLCWETAVWLPDDMRDEDTLNPNYRIDDINASEYALDDLDYADFDKCYNKFIDIFEDNDFDYQAAQDRNNSFMEW